MHKLKLSEFENRSLAQLAKALREQLGAEEVLLYGSAARGEMDEASDIDLFVVLPKVDWQIEKKVIRLCFDTELKCGRVFSAVCYSRDDIQNSPIAESPLVLNVRKQGQVL